MTTVCFDKTGTLTQDFMALKGILPFNLQKKFEEKMIEQSDVEFLIN